MRSMRSTWEALPSRFAILACGLTVFAAACGGGGGGGTGGAAGTKTDGGAGGVKTDGGTGGAAGAKTDAGTGGTTGAGGKMDAGGDSGDALTGAGGAGTGGMAGGTGGIMLTLPWHAFLPLNMAGPGSTSSNGMVLDLTANHYDGTYFGNTITFGNGSMNLVGSGSEFVVVPPKGGVPAVDVTGSYSVSAWVTLTNTSNFRTVVGGEGANISSFFLQKRGDGPNAWSFTTIGSDATSAPACIAPPPVPIDGGPAQSPVSPQANVQYHLVGTADSTTGVHLLYVNGVESGRANCAVGPSWADTGILGIGHGIFNTGRVDNVAGSIAEVGVINRALTAAEVAALYAHGRIGMPTPDAGTDTGVDAPADAPADAPPDTPADTGPGDTGGSDVAADGGVTDSGAATDAAGDGG